MKHLSSLARTTLGFVVGSAGLAVTFIAILVRAVMRSPAPHGVPTAADARFGAAALLLLIVGFIAALAAARRGARPIPSARTGFIAGVAGVTSLLCVMMLAGEPLGMGGSLVVAALAGIASAVAAIRTTRSGVVSAAAI